MRMINVLSKNDVERIIRHEIDKILKDRLSHIENALDKLRLKVNDLDRIIATR